jgi:hypothetical protein
MRKAVQDRISRRVRIGDSNGPAGVFDYGRIDIEQNDL